MKVPRIVTAVEHIDDELILEAAKNRKKKQVLVKWGAFAACFTALVIAGVLILPSLIGKDKIVPEETDGRYKNFGVSESDVAIVWPWEYLAESEKPYETEIQGIKYEKTSGRTVSEEYIGSEIGIYNIVAYYETDEERHTVECAVYSLKNINQTEFVAVKIADNYYVFKNSVYNPPQTLGQMFERVDLSQLIKLERFSENGDGPDAKHFVLNEDKYVWEVLLECREAEFIDQDEEYWHIYDRDFISFSISCEALGIYKHDFSVTKDGYLSTNAFDWGYLYYIGEEAAERIIKYAMENSKATEYEPYSNTKFIYGKVVEIADEYILVDDSSLCKNEADGIVYKILLNDIRISRYIDRKIISVGDTVQVSYEGEIDEQNSNTVSSAFSISDVHIFYEQESEEQNYDRGSSSTASKEVASVIKGETQR